MSVRLPGGVLAALIVAALGAAPAAGAVELGRLFLSPAERDALDRARRDQAAVAQEAPTVVRVEAPSSEPLPPEVVLDPVRVDGYVSRSDGPPTIWINGTDSYQGNFGEHGLDPAQVQLERARVRLPLGEAANGVLLKPGQTFDPDTEQVRDAYERQPEMLLTR